MQVESVENPSAKELANAINEAFLEPLKEYHLPQPLAQLPVDEGSMEVTEVLKLRTYNFLTKLNPSKSCGPDEIPNYVATEGIC